MCKRVKVVLIEKGKKNIKKHLEIGKRIWDIYALGNA